MKQFQLPALLAGPILRRVESSQVYIWAATSEAYSIKASFYYVGDNYTEVAIQHEQHTVQMGKHLYVHLIKVTTSEGYFKTNVLIGYNLSFEIGTQLFDLADLGLLTKASESSLIYGDMLYPSFYISDSNKPTPIIYGSCRKPHGEGKDMLALGDQVMREHYDDIFNRPGSLFLLGDQIYADDVADPLVRPLAFLVEQLIGHNEKLSQLDGRLEHSYFQAALKQINGRGYMMKHFGKFTSSSASNHLIELGEYAVMYLLSWSPALWELMLEQQLFDSFEDAYQKNDVYFVFTDEYVKEHKAERKQRGKHYRNQRNKLLTFYKSLYQVRRLLANTPAYMIFDDHDITDDWNLSHEWKEDVMKAPIGKHIVSNGLTAYWAFQGWGNNPDTFDASFIATIKKYINGLMDGHPMEYYQAWTEQMWSFNQWHFIAPTNPKAVFLDTRTQRQYDLCPKPYKVGRFIEEAETVPQLLSRSGWEAVAHSLINSEWQGGQPLIIVSAAPVYGMGLIENVMHDYTMPLRLLGVNVNSTFDFETWKYNGKGFTAFLQQVAEWNADPCIILSGDVHYSSSVYATVQFQNGKELCIKQFTSSPQNNMSFTSLWGKLLKVVIWFKSKYRERRDLYRYCNEAGRIQHIEGSDIQDVSYIWKDQLRYQPIKRKSIVETKNNIGYIRVENREAKHQLLTEKDSK